MSMSQGLPLLRTWSPWARPRACRPLRFRERLFGGCGAGDAGAAREHQAALGDQLAVVATAYQAEYVASIGSDRGVAMTPLVHEKQHACFHAEAAPQNTRYRDS